MEISEFTDFCRQLKRWPKDEAEVSTAAERLRIMLGALWVYLSPKGLTPGISTKPSLGNKVPSWLLELTRSIPGKPTYSERLESRDFRYFFSGPIEGGSGTLIVASEQPFDYTRKLVIESVLDRLWAFATVAQMEEQIRLRDQFLSIASHELKTPLTSIYGLLQLQERMIRPKPGAPAPDAVQEKQHSFLKIVIRQVERLNDLIDGLLNVSRIQIGRFMVEPSEVDAAPIVMEALNGRLNVIAQEAGVSIQADVPSNMMAWVDPIRLEEVVTNLVMNAIRFSPEGGVVWTKLYEDEGHALHLRVRDQGPSISPADRERIFQPFERAQRSSRLGGLGLGLFISRQIAQLHGGDVVVVESVPGKGNVLEAHFPPRRGLNP